MKLAMLARTGGLAFVLGIAWTGAARANPIIVDDMRGLQVPTSMHVQLTYLCGVPEMCTWPVGLERNGQGLSATWLEPGALTINAGSGLVEYEARQTCDCDIPAGTYTYALTYADGVVPDYPFEVSVTVTDPPPDPPEPGTGTGTGTGTGSMDPWDIPEPPWPQGTDCSVWCSENPDDGGTDTTTDGGGGTDGGGDDGGGTDGDGDDGGADGGDPPTDPGDDGTTGPAQSDGGGSKGCAVTPSGATPQAFGIALCAMVLGLTRRRRRLN